VVFAADYVRERFEAVAGPVVGEAVVRPQGLYVEASGEDELRRLRAEGRARIGVGKDPVDPEQRRAAQLWHAQVARQFGLEHTDASDSMKG
jgi:hypothetical protein